MEKTSLLTRHWREVANRLEGKALKAKYTRVQTIKQAEGVDEVAKIGLLNELSRADEAMSPNKEIMKEKQKQQAEPT